MNSGGVGNFLQQNQKEWLNQDLIKTIASNPKLQSFFTNPEFMSAVQMLQTNPQAVMAKYKDNPEFTEGLNLLSSTMGKHFESLGQKEEPKKEELKKPSAIRILRETAKGDSEALEILKDKKVRMLVKCLANGQFIDFQGLFHSDPQTGMKMQILIQKGLLNVARK